MEYLESSQAEQLREIGAKLNQERQARSVSLEEVAAKTFIPMRLLNAIEAGRLDLLPEPVFVQGFIRRYADTLGLDGGTLSKAFAVEPPVPRHVAEVPQLEPIQPASEVHLPDWSNWLRQPQRLYLIGGAIGLGVIGLIAASLASRPKVVQPPQPNQKPVTSAIVPAKKPQPPAASPSVALSPNPTSSIAPSVAPSAAPAATGPVEVKLNLTDESWMEVVVDGKVAYEGTLPKGTQKTWMGKQRVAITSGNAGAVSASYNNGAAKTLGALGAVASVSFPPAAPATGN